VKTVQTHGVAGLYRGLTSLLIGTAPKASLRFTVFSQVSKMMQDDKGKTSAFGTWFAGAMAGLLEATLVVTPVETMKTKLIHDQVGLGWSMRGWGARTEERQCCVLVVVLLFPVLGVLWVVADVRMPLEFLQ
jgi:hypothetical protein